MTDDALLI